jgi:hypothetical protein
MEKDERLEGGISGINERETGAAQVNLLILLSSSFHHSAHYMFDLFSLDYIFQLQAIKVLINYSSNMHKLSLQIKVNNLSSLSLSLSRARTHTKST